MDDVRDVVAIIDRFFHELVQLFPFDDLERVQAALEQFGQDLMMDGVPLFLGLWTAIISSSSDLPDFRCRRSFM